MKGEQNNKSSFVGFLKQFNPMVQRRKLNKNGLQKLESKEVFNELDYQKTAYLSDN